MASLVRSPIVLVLVAAGAGLLWPSPALADRADAVLAGLVLAATLTISPRRLWETRRAAPRAGLLALLPLATLLPIALGLGSLFPASERDGLLALGLAPTEVASIGLVAIAGGSAALALLATVLSLVVTALGAPLLAPLLAGGDVDARDLAVRFSLVVLVPLAAGLALRLSSRLAPVERIADPVATVLLALLVYAALGDLDSAAGLGTPALAAVSFLAASVAVALALRPLVGELRTGGLAFALRDFAVAAALAVQLGGPGAPTAAVYGVVMLVVASIGATAMRGRRRQVDGAR